MERTKSEEEQKDDVKFDVCLQWFHSNKKIYIYWLELDNVSLHFLCQLFHGIFFH